MTNAVAKLDRRTGPRVAHPQMPFGYTKDSHHHYLKSQNIRKFLVPKGTASPSSAKTYATHLKAFAYFVYKSHPELDVDAFIDEIKKGKHDPCDVLADFAKFLRESRTGKQKLGGKQMTTDREIVKRVLSKLDDLDSFCGLAVECNEKEVKEKRK